MSAKVKMQALKRYLPNCTLIFFWWREASSQMRPGKYNILKSLQDFRQCASPGHPARYQDRVWSKQHSVCARAQSTGVSRWEACWSKISQTRPLGQQKLTSRVRGSGAAELALPEASRWLADSRLTPVSSLAVLLGGGVCVLISSYRDTSHIRPHKPH